MPEATAALREEWNGPDDSVAMGYLRDRGYVLDGNWNWIVPRHHTPTEKECSAICFLMQEWDMGGYITQE